MSIYYPEDKFLIKEILARYEFALPFVKEGITLDLGCGARMGPWILADKTKEVVGVDISEEAVHYAQERWRRENLIYLVCDGTNLSFKQEAFDTIVSFEVIEHIKDYRDYLREIKRVLKTGGICILSTPNKDFGHPLNPEHQKEFSLEEFQNLVSEFFSKVDIYGEQRKKEVRISSGIPQIVLNITYLDIFKLRRLIPKAVREKVFSFLVRSLRQITGVPQEEDITINSFEIAKHDLSKARYLVGICQK